MEGSEENIHVDIKAFRIFRISEDWLWKFWLVRWNTRRAKVGARINVPRDQKAINASCAYKPEVNDNNR